jgi:hypothetical protein
MAVVASASAWIGSIGAAATAVGVALAYPTLRAARREALATHYFDLMNHLQSAEMVAARRRLLDHWDNTKAPLSLPTGDETLDAAAGVVSSSLSTAGRVLRLGYVPGEAFLDEYAPLIVRMHAILSAYLDTRRTERDDPGYHASFTLLASWAEWFIEWHAQPWRRRVLAIRRPWRRGLFNRRIT